MNRSPPAVGPADRCPYSSMGFSSCPAFEELRFEALDSVHQSLGEAVTCRHLQTGRRDSTSFYPSCRLGDEASRRAFIAARR